MATTKRRAVDSSSQSAKKPKTTHHAPLDVDFPRGGGTSLSAAEVKALRKEAAIEADAELITNSSNNVKRSHKVPKPTAKVTGKSRKQFEHLSYKRISIGMKVLGIVVAIQPLALVVALPDRLFAHVPITNVSSQLTSFLEMIEEDMDDNDELESNPPELADIFVQGQYVRAVVSGVHTSGSANDTSGLAKSRDETIRLSRRIELSLIPSRVNSGVQKSDVKRGFTLSAAVRNVEDHGYTLDLGIPDLEGFMSFKNAVGGPFSRSLGAKPGYLLDVVVSEDGAHSRVCSVVSNPDVFIKSYTTEPTNASSVLPGTLVQCLITDVEQSGLHLQVLGLFEGAINQNHLDENFKYKVGKKIKARILFDIPGSPPSFALSHCQHVMALTSKTVARDDRSLTLEEAFPAGTLIESATVSKSEQDRGLVMEIGSDAQGFVHISHISDEHVTELPNTKFGVRSSHRARVMGTLPFDGMVQLSLKSSILDRPFLQFDEIQIGEVLNGTVKSLTDAGLFVSLSSNLDGLIWPNHYADIPLKHPERRFRKDASIRCKVLSIDLTRRRVTLTAKRTLVESTLPILSRFEDARMGLLTDAVISKASEKSLIIEFYNGLNAIVPLKEASEEAQTDLRKSFSGGQLVKVRITGIDRDRQRITASIRQSGAQYDFASDINAVEIGNHVEGDVLEIQKNHIMLILQPTHIRALLSLDNLSNHRGLTSAQTRLSLKTGERLKDLIVVSRNPEKDLIIVANRPSAKASDHRKPKKLISLDTIETGQEVTGRVTKHLGLRALIKFGHNIGGILHLTDVSDDYGEDSSLPLPNAIIKANVVAIDSEKRQLQLSTRPSRLLPDSSRDITDREILSLDHIKIGQTVRGFVKNVTDQGLFVALSKDIDARVCIRELFDEYIKDWQPRFKAGQLVQGKILSLDPGTKRMEMSFRTKESLPRADSIEAGKVVSGTITRIEPFGLFIRVENSKISGLCHKSEISDTPDADVTTAIQSFREGDRVKASVLSMDKNRVSFSLRPSKVEEVVKPPESGDSIDDGALSKPSDDPMIIDDTDGDEESSVISGPSNSSDDDVSHHLDDNASSGPTQTVLSLPTGFQWSVGALSDSSASDSEEEVLDRQPITRSSKRGKARTIELDVTGRMQESTPESNADFERVLLGSPNSSYLWIQYMSFQLQLSDVEKAREIARRALETISLREEQERLNVWIALLNLENAFGNESTLDAAFKDAARANDGKTVYLRLAAIFEQSQKYEKAEEHYEKTRKKYGRSCKVWTLMGEHYFKKGDIESARNLLPRSLQSLEKRKHLKTVSRFAQMEYKLGDPERGKTLFEGLVNSHPKRWDIWSIYIAMEHSQGDIQNLRHLFDRIFAVKMTNYKAKAFFKKWLEIEKQLGDEDGQTNVKQKALEWTQRQKTDS